MGAVPAAGAFFLGVDIMGWTDERVALLRKYWAEGLSASQISKQLGGVTRNAIIGKVHRLGLSGRATPSAKRPARPRRPPSPTAHLLAIAKAYVPPGEPVTPKMMAKARADHAAAIEASARLEPVVLEDGRPADVHRLDESMCKFPVGDPSDSSFAFCGRGVSAPGRCYCADHERLCYIPTAKKKRQAGGGHDAELRRMLRELA